MKVGVGTAGGIGARVRAPPSLGLSPITHWDLGGPRPSGVSSTHPFLPPGLSFPACIPVEAMDLLGGALICVSGCLSRRAVQDRRGGQETQATRAQR